MTSQSNSMPHTASAAADGDLSSRRKPNHGFLRIAVKNVSFRNVAVYRSLAAWGRLVWLAGGFGQPAPHARGAFLAIEISFFCLVMRRQ
jgi:hypothetical protein